MQRAEGTAGAVSGGRILVVVTFSRRTALFLLAFGVWSWLLWPAFFRNIWINEKAWAGGSPTAFLYVHFVIAAVSLVLGTIIGVLGWRAFRATRG